MAKRKEEVVVEKKVDKKVKDNEIHNLSDKENRIGGIVKKNKIGMNN